MSKVVALMVVALLGLGGCECRVRSKAPKGRRAQNQWNQPPQGYNGQPMYQQAMWNGGQPGQYPPQQPQQQYPQYPAQGPAGFQPPPPQGAQGMPMPDRNLEVQAAQFNPFAYLNPQPQSALSPNESGPFLTTADQGQGPVPRATQSTGAIPGQLNTDFVAQYNQFMQNRVNQLNDQFPWTFRPDDCDLSMEIFPFYYTPILRASSLRIIFSSNCLTSRDVTFEVSYDDELFINWIFHPTTFYLNLWNNVYRLEFSQPAVIDRYDIMKSLEYTRVTIFNANARPQVIDLNSRNVVYLRPQQIYSFNRDNLRKLRNVRGYFKCEKTSRRLNNWQAHAAKRDDLVTKMRKDGETEEAILAAVDKVIQTAYQAENSQTIVPPVLPSADQLRTASFEVKEEVERIRAREVAKRAFMREFIDDFEIDCQIL